MGDRENWKFGKLNQQKIHMSSFPSVDGTSVSAIMKKLKNGCHFFNIDRTETFQITTTPPKVWISGFLSVDRNRISMSGIMKKLKNGCHFFNIDNMEKFQITNPPKVWISGFPSVHRNRISASVIMKKLKNGSHFFHIDRMEKFQITKLPKVWISGFLSVDRNGISVSAIMKKLKNGSHFFNINHMENFQITDPPKFGSPGFFSSKNWRCKFSFFLNFPLAYFSSSPILGSMSTFMHGHLCISDLPLESPMCSFTLPDICVILESNIVSNKKYKNNDYSICFKIFMGFRGCTLV